jgi:hypothetical protein
MEKRTPSRLLSVLSLKLGTNSVCENGIDLIPLCLYQSNELQFTDPHLVITIIDGRTSVINTCEII